jgi:methionyl-tRNA formyltransferase
MRFAITAIDRYLGVFEELVKAGWEPVRLFTVPMRSFIDSHHAVIAYAEQRGVGIQLSRMDDHDMRGLAELGCDILVVASYNWKIGDWRPHLKYAVNFHASPLPDGRGSYPPVRAIMERYDKWAVTCHKLTPEIDQGDILAAENFPLQRDECHESIDLKIQMAAKRLAAKVAGGFEDLWAQAKPQNRGDYWPRWTNKDRLINFLMPVEPIMRQLRAFGLLECLASANNTLLSVRRAVGWTEPHSHTPGHVVHVCNRTIVIAAADGYIGLVEWGFAPDEILADLQAQAPGKQNVGKP